MTRNEFNDSYFCWMYHLVCDRDNDTKRYKKLLYFLHSVEFTYSIAMDGNRCEDGIDLRYRFGYEENLEYTKVARYLDDKPCSVLEMMVALAIRLEEHIMADPEIGNRTKIWFWEMIKNLGLDGMSDDCFDEEAVDDIIHKFLERDYSSNGEGGLFKIEYGKYSKYDMRDVEIWYQACWYLDSVVR